MKVTRLPILEEDEKAPEIEPERTPVDDLIDSITQFPAPPRVRAQKARSIPELEKRIRDLEKWAAAVVEFVSRTGPREHAYRKSFKDFR